MMHLLANGATELSTTGLVFMLAVWSCVLVLMIWSYGKILIPPKPPGEDEEPHE